MSGYNGRRGPNVSQYLANLNTIPSQQDLLAEPLNLEEELAVFTSAEFIDWDAAGADLNNLNSPLDFLDSEQHSRQRPSRSHGTSSRLGGVDSRKMDFHMTGKCLACHFTFAFRPHHVVFASCLRTPLPACAMLRHWLWPGCGGPRLTVCIAQSSSPTRAGHSHHTHTVRGMRFPLHPGVHHAGCDPASWARACMLREASFP